MKRYFLTLLLPLFAFSVMDWVPVQLDKRASIKFPQQPENIGQNGTSIWVSDLDSTARCMALIVDFADFGLDSAQVSEIAGSDEFNSQIKDGIMSKVSGATVLEEKNYRKDGNAVYDITIGKDVPDSSFIFSRVYNRNIIYGTRLYSLSFYEKTGLDAAREEFFNSFRLK